MNKRILIVAVEHGQLDVQRPSEVESTAALVGCIAGPLDNIDYVQAAYPLALITNVRHGT